EWLFYDRQTWLIDKAIRVVEDERATVAFDDYRATKGLKQPWHLHYHSGGFDFDFVRHSLTIGGSVDPAPFAMPKSTFAFAKFSGDTALPARVLTDRTFVFGGWLTIVNPTPSIVIRVMVNGRGLDFGVSAAQPDSLIDLDVARELGLSSFGQLLHAGGEDLSYDTMLGEARIGGLTLHDFALRATRFQYQETYQTKIVGMLGYDVLSAGVLKVDYVNGSVVLSPAESFNADSPIPGASTLLVEFDSGFPFFKGVINGHESSDILLDNDFDESIIFGGFAQRFPESVPELYTGKEKAKASIPFADSRRFGSEVLVWTASVPEIRWGPAHFFDLHIVSSTLPIRRGGHNVDAVMGGDLLAFFDLYFDYPHGRVLLKPNSVFHKTWKARQ
ncbi:MAG TPA: hypothetical protein VN934_08885, partial [Candidatus Tumulicola sp.]|nr:hypothetical protein [Candidatus Tumulicola sp.]